MAESAARIIRSARERSALSQRDLGILAGIPQSAISAYESGRKQPSFQALTRIVGSAGFSLSIVLNPTEATVLPGFSGPAGRKVQRQRQEFRELLAQRNLERPEIFGSIARGDDRPDSDLDVLVDVPDGVGLFALAAVKRESEDLLGVPVDLVPRAGLKSMIAETIARDLVPL
ncbi:XRE family transcriptional regulator [Subtercola endophyticus]|uniref:XRE family transcriptional regulator n=1 Tax=Subtercola endophyticus TaxID=2895559 RepID=UPI001E403B31|nr:XRE family transcriptional regulator [Subtercola endophyticus]UFS60917.1 XRE family transcriptional regulator [Subtercola endophyticus]